MDPHTEAEQQRAGCPVATETTPLLPSTAPASASPSPPAPRAVLAGLWITAAGGVAVITLALSVFVAVEFHSPPIYGLPWEIKRAVFQAVLTGFIAGAWATASLWRIRRIAKLMPSLAAVPTYAALAFWLVGTSVVGAQDFFESDPCWQRYPDERKFICLHWAEKFNVLLGFYLASLLVLGLAHTVLFVFFCSVPFRGISWRNVLRGWSFPTGQFTVEFTVRLLKQERDLPARPAENTSRVVEEA